MRQPLARLFYIAVVEGLRFPPARSLVSITLRVLILTALCLCWGGGGRVAAQRVSIGLYDTCATQVLELRPLTEGYKILLEGRMTPLPTDQPLLVQRQGRTLAFQHDSLVLGTAAHAAVLHSDVNAQIQLTLLQPKGTPRIYDGNMSLFVDFGRVMCLNLVDPENYIAGVALAEVGPRAKPELYKAQALLIRTYLMANRAKHIDEGFNLCDQVHCQAYKGSASAYPAIKQATQATAGMVVVDTQGELITSVFHANCGGQTASARDVWLTESPYLLSVRDPYCLRSKGASWKKNLPLTDWLRFLHSKGVATQNIPIRGYLYRSDAREGMYELPGGIAVPFRDLREYFNLKSAWFDVSVDGGTVRLSGRGYGHGIGMCQEGAMRMAEEGKKAQEIIIFYFKGTRIVPYSSKR